jgi:hypothetical protein
MGECTNSLDLVRIESIGFPMSQPLGLYLADCHQRLSKPIIECGAMRQVLARVAGHVHFKRSPPSLKPRLIPGPANCTGKKKILQHQGKSLAVFSHP